MKPLTNHKLSSIYAGAVLGGTVLDKLNDNAVESASAKAISILKGIILKH